jgi:flagellar basal body rod protein FlgG
MVTNYQPLVNAGNKNFLRLQLSANNIANSNSVGFKAERIYFYQEKPPAGALRSEPVYNSILKIDFSPGNITSTGNPLDLALDGKGYFSLKDGEGVSYTRKGNFTLDKAGRLVSMSGLPVLGEGGEIIVPSGKIQFKDGGELYVDGNMIARLQIMTFADEGQLRKKGDSLFVPARPDEAVRATEVSVKAGYLEMSNVKVIQEMVEIINEQHRLMDIYQRATHTVAELDKISTSRIGRLV